MQNLFLMLMLVLFMACCLLGILNSCTIGNNDDDSDFISPIPDADIIPGNKLFELIIGDLFSTCRNKYGEPVITGYGGDSSGHSSFTVEYFELGLLLEVTDSENNEILDDTDKIELISLHEPSNWEGTTFRGNGLGCSLDSVKKEFGECEDFLWSDSCYYNSIGINWYFFEDLATCGAITIY